jgi:hypothetical protein
MHGMCVFVIDFWSHVHGHRSLESIAEMVVMAASATVSTVVGIIGNDAGLGRQSAAMEVQWCVSPINVLMTFCQLFLSRSISIQGKAPLIPDAYIYLFGVPCPVSLSSALTVIPLLSETPSRSTNYVARNRGSPGWATICAMLNGG